MSKTPKRPRQRNDHRQQGDAAGGQPPKSPTRKPRAAPKRKADAVVDAANVELSSEVMEGPEGNSASSTLSERGNPLARDHSVVAEGTQNASDQQSPHSRVKDEAEQQVQTVALADDHSRTEPDQSAAGAPAQPSAEAGVRGDSTLESAQHHPMAPDPKSDSGEDDKRTSRIAPQSISDRVRNTSARMEVRTQTGMAHGAPMNQQADERATPLYILAAITLGIPALLSIALIGLNPGVQDGTFATILGFVLLSAFVTAVVFEIRRLVDQPSDADQH